MRGRVLFEFLPNGHNHHFETIERKSRGKVRKEAVGESLLCCQASHERRAKKAMRKHLEDAFKGAREELDRLKPGGIAEMPVPDNYVVRHKFVPWLRSYYGDTIEINPHYIPISR